MSRAVDLPKPKPLIPWTELAKQAKFREVALAREFGRSSKKLRRYFADELGLPLGQWLYHRRWEYALQLVHARVPLKRISDEIGLSHMAAVSRGLRIRYGVGVMKLRKNPGEYVLAIAVPQDANVNKSAGARFVESVAVGSLR